MDTSVLVVYRLPFSKNVNFPTMQFICMSRVTLSLFTLTINSDDQNSLKAINYHYIQLISRHDIKPSGSAVRHTTQSSRVGGAAVLRGLYPVQICFSLNDNLRVNTEQHLQGYSMTISQSSQYFYFVSMKSCSPYLWYDKLF